MLICVSLALFLRSSSLLDSRLSGVLIMLERSGALLGSQFEVFGFVVGQNIRISSFLEHSCKKSCDNINAKKINEAYFYRVEFKFQTLKQRMNVRARFFPNQLFLELQYSRMKNLKFVTKFYRIMHQVGSINRVLAIN